ncbi:hypothetical protein LMG14418_1502 [Lactococcus lactis subsp. lactis]|nr:hypothetical protein LMG14418_1502 [Lactococcus lactis subsp. lactis]
MSSNIVIVFTRTLIKSLENGFVTSFTEEKKIANSLREISNLF